MATRRTTAAKKKIAKIEDYSHLEFTPDPITPVEVYGSDFEFPDTVDGEAGVNKYTVEDFRLAEEDDIYLDTDGFIEEFNDWDMHYVEPRLILRRVVGRKFTLTEVSEEDVYEVEFAYENKIVRAMVDEVED